jgi:hypothetical protein
MNVNRDCKVLADIAVPHQQRDDAPGDVRDDGRRCRDGDGIAKAQQLVGFVE